MSYRRIKTCTGCRKIVLKSNKKFCLSLHYNGANTYLFDNGTEIIIFKTKKRL